MARLKKLKKSEATPECLNLLSLLPNFASSGNVAGMKKQYYGNDALLVKHGSFIYNCSSEPHIYNSCAE